MNSIIIDAFGATLIPRKGDRADWNPVYLGKHEGCVAVTGLIGDMFVVYHSSTHNAIHCQQCFLRVLVPNQKLPSKVSEEIFEPLCQYFAEVIKQRSRFLQKINSIGEPTYWAPASVFDDDIDCSTCGT